MDMVRMTYGSNFSLPAVLLINVLNTADNSSNVDLLICHGVSGSAVGAPAPNSN